jgi:hypothetical protein
MKLYRNVAKHVKFAPGDSLVDLFCFVRVIALDLGKIAIFNFC